MSLNHKLSCARCKAYLFDEDDVVYCPVCGAPHHRECYNALGRCALEELHGTERQYSKEQAEASCNTEKQEDNANFKKDNQENDFEYVTCNMCGKKYNRASRSCEHCGAPNIANMQGFTSFDFLGGIPKDYKIAENVTADEAKRFVMANSHRYIPKFAILNKGKKISWNWFAFLFPSGWMLSRKMLKNGIVTAVLTILAALLTYPLSLALYKLDIQSAKNYAELISSIYNALPDIGIPVIVSGIAGSVIDIIIRVISAMFGDYMYKNHTVAQIAKIKQESDDIDASYRKYGGINIFYFFIAVFAIQYIPAIITAFM